MKNILISIAAIALFFGSCNHQPTHQSNTHTHEDGTVHDNHQHSDEMPEQELFELKTDSLHHENDTIKQKAEKEYTHDDGKPHKH